MPPALVAVAVSFLHVFAVPRPFYCLKIEVLYSCLISCIYNLTRTWLIQRLKLVLVPIRLIIIPIRVQFGGYVVAVLTVIVIMRGTIMVDQIIVWRGVRVRVGIASAGVVMVVYLVGLLQFFVGLFLQAAPLVVVPCIAIVAQAATIQLTSRQWQVVCR